MKQLLLVIALSGAITSYSQVTYGVKAGLNLYNFTGKDVKDANLDQYRSLKPGLVAGGFVEFPVANKITIQPGLLYSQEGNFQKNGDAKAIIKFNYLNLPVVVKYNDPSGFFGETGPQIGYLLNAKVKSVVGGNDTETDLDEGIRNTHFAWTVGAGWKFKNGFGVNARSQWSLSSAFEDAKVGNSGFYASVFYVFCCSHGTKK